MARANVRVVAGILLLSLGGCAGYREAAFPYISNTAASEFDGSHRVNVGDKIRLTTRSGAVIEGVFVSLEDSVVTMVATAPSTGVVAIPVVEVDILEVHMGVSGKTVGRTVAVVAGSAVIYAIIRDATHERVFYPDGTTVAR